MPNTTNLPFPIKGVNRTFARTAQPDGTAYDMLNVLPFDSQLSRLRGGSRAGTVNQYAETLDGPVKLMSQVASIVPGATSSPIFTEGFNYAAENWPDGGTTEGWTVYANPDGFDVNGSGILRNAPTGGGVAWRLTPSTTSGTDSAADIRFRIPSTQATLVGTGNTDVRIACRLANFTSEYVNARLNFDIVDLFAFGTILFEVYDNDGHSTGNIPVPSGTLSYDTWYTLRVVTTGTTVKGYLDGVLFGTLTGSTTPNTYTGYGFWITPNDGGVIDVDSVIAYDQTAGEDIRVNNLIVVAGGNVHVGDLDSLPQATGGSGVINSSAIPQSAFILGKMYFVDGGTIKQLDVDSATMETYTATAGTAPTESTLCCAWRTRLVTSFKQNFFFSRLGVPTDWDYGQEDPATAFAGNASEAGRIGEDILAHIPASDDQLYFCGDRTIWLVNGDPADGGSIDIVSDNVGILGPNAWVKAPDGTIYIVGTAGFYRLIGGQQPVNVSRDIWSQFFASLSRTNNRITLAWDRDLHGCYIYIFPTGFGVTAASQCVWFDERTQGFFPLEFPQRYGPWSTAIFDGSEASDRRLLMGGNDGNIYATSATATDDDGDEIDSYVIIGPFLIGDARNDGQVEDVTFVFGAPLTGFNVDVEVRTGRTPEEVTSGTPSRTVEITYSDPNFSRPTMFRRRVRGVWASVVLGSDTGGIWAFESLTINSTVLGLTRGH